ncbi:MAG: hypothetical protein AAGN66_20650 [Acidobacteriota bacterium]
MLRDAATAYLDGDYESVVSRLETLPRQPKARAHGLLLRAAARYRLFLLGGGRDYGLRSQAIDDVQACRKAAPDLEPAEGVFSPRFRDFFSGME